MPNVLRIERMGICRANNIGRKSRYGEKKKKKARPSTEMSSNNERLARADAQRQVIVAIVPSDGIQVGFRVANGRDNPWVFDNAASIVACVFEVELSSDVAEVAAVCREGSVKR